MNFPITNVEVECLLMLSKFLEYNNFDVYDYEIEDNHVIVIISSPKNHRKVLGVPLSREVLLKGNDHDILEFGKIAMAHYLSKKVL